jgi:hypothetical protein
LSHRPRAPLRIGSKLTEVNLREAIWHANANPGLATIEVAVGTDLSENGSSDDNGVLGG